MTSRSGGISSAGFSVALSSDDVWHLALFLKRVSWDEIRGNAQDDAEADAVQDRVLVEGLAVPVRDARGCGNRGRWCRGRNPGSF